MRKSEKADYLHQLANELRLSGYLLQSLEAFRRALILNPKDAWLIFDFARCLHSFAGSEKSEKLASKSICRASSGGKTRRCRRRIAGASGRKLFSIRRLANAPLQSLKKRLIRRRPVFVRFAVWRKSLCAKAKSRMSFTNLQPLTVWLKRPALRRWTQNEQDYFSRLNSDEDYMEMEISRVNLLENLENAEKDLSKNRLLRFSRDHFRFDFRGNYYQHRLGDFLHFTVSFGLG